MTSPAGDADLVLEVGDDGAGLPAQRRDGVGLSSMAERAGEIGGELPVGVRPGRRHRRHRPAAAAQHGPRPGGRRMIRVLLADDHPAFLRGLQTMLAETGQIDVVGTATDGRAAVDAARELRPDAVVMDLHMPELDGVDATALLTAQLPGTAVLVLTMHDDDASLHAALQAGARGYLLKEAGGDDIVRALVGVVNGDAVFGRAVAPRVLGRMAAESAGAANRLPMLTSRETEVLDLVARGRTNAQIAAALFLSAKTVRNHVSNILVKLPARDRVAAAELARAAGLAADQGGPAWRAGAGRPAGGPRRPGDPGTAAP